MFGVALNMAGEHAEPLVNGHRRPDQRGVPDRRLGHAPGPIGTFGALAAVIATYGAESLAQLGYLILVFLGTCVVYVIVVLGLIMRACKLSLFGLMRFLKAELLIALATCSSEAVLPQLVRKLEILGVGRPVVGIVIPAGFSFNLDGSAVYLTMATLFLAQAVGIDLTWQQQLVMVGVMMLTSKGTAGIAGGAFIVLASTLTAVGGIPLAALALIVGIDRILNEGRVFINVLGNAIATIVIGKWEDDFDHDKAQRVLRATPAELDAIEAEYNAAQTAAPRTHHGQVPAGVTTENATAPTSENVGSQPGVAPPQRGARALVGDGWRTPLLPSHQQLRLVVDVPGGGVGGRGSRGRRTTGPRSPQNANEGFAARPGPSVACATAVLDPKVRVAASLARIRVCAVRARHRRRGRRPHRPGASRREVFGGASCRHGPVRPQ